MYERGSVCVRTRAAAHPPQACPHRAPTGLVCCTAAIQQEEELSSSCAQVSRLRAQVRAEAQHQHGVQQDVLVEASLQEPHLNMGAQMHLGPGSMQLQPELAAGPRPGASFYLSSSQVRPPGSYTCRSTSLFLRWSLWKSRRALTRASYSAELRLPASSIRCGWWGSGEEGTQLCWRSLCLWIPTAQS